jgi:hypothetical protein
VCTDAVGAVTVVFAGTLPAVGDGYAAHHAPSGAIPHLPLHLSVGPPPAPPARRLPRGAEAQSRLISVASEGFETLESRAQEGHAVYLRGSLSGRLFRVSPVRDPAQPRLWCLLIERCATTGVNGLREEAVLGTEAMPREEVLGALNELRANPAKWLGQPRRKSLRVWLRGSGDVTGAVR